MHGRILGFVENAQYIACSSYLGHASKKLGVQKKYDKIINQIELLKYIDSQKFEML
jgi:phage anti-repressor protein